MARFSLPKRLKPISPCQCQKTYGSPEQHAWIYLPGRVLINERYGPSCSSFASREWSMSAPSSSISSHVS